MKLWKRYWPSFIFLVYAIIVITEIVVFFGVMGLEWGFSDEYFAELGLWGSILWYPVAGAWLLAVNPITYALGFVSCGDLWCLPSLAGTISNLLLISAIIFLFNLAVLKFIERRRQRRMVTREN